MQAALETTENRQALRQLIEQIANTAADHHFATEEVVEGVCVLRIHDRLRLNHIVGWELREQIIHRVIEIINMGRV